VIVGGFALVATAGAVLALTPWGSAPVRRADLQQVALAARGIVPAEESILFLGGNYFSIAHQVVFYSDRTLTRLLDDPAIVRRALDAGGWALLSAEGYRSVAGSDTASIVAVVASGQWVLAHRSPAPRVVLEAVRPGD
jgi:hypothetical protein